MFNWTYFLLYTAFGYCLGGVAHIHTNPHRMNEWPSHMIWLAHFALLFSLGFVAIVIYSFITFGAFWGFITIGEIVLGAILSGYHLVNK